MKEYLVIFTKSFTIKAENQEDAEEKANELLWDIDPEADIEIVEEL